MLRLPAETDVRVAVPENAFGGDRPLVAVMRGNYVSAVHRGTAAVVDAAGEDMIALGDTEQPAFLRSAAKPFQAMPALLTGGVDRFALDERELAVLCASHNAEPRHREAVLSVLDKIGLQESALQCGAHPPLHEESARQLWRAGHEPSPACNNCSGAHAGMLVACRAAGWPTETYTDPHHPLQVMIRRVLGAFADVPAERLEYATDNCAIPTFRLPIRRAAQAFARLATQCAVQPDLAAAARRVVAAMTRYPEMVGGEERFDTDLMRAAGGVVAKGGAEGFQGVGLVTAGLGLAIKISDGGSRAVAPAAVRLLEHLGALSPSGCAGLDAYRETPVRDMQGETVGRLVPVFSLDGGR